MAGKREVKTEMAGGREDKRMLREDRSGKNGGTTSWEEDTERRGKRNGGRKSHEMKKWREVPGEREREGKKEMEGGTRRE